jgi:hypothetical protein
MANVKITDLVAATTPLAGTELLELVQSGVSTKVAASSIAASATNVRTVATGGTGAATLTGYVKGTGTTAMTAAATVPVADISGTLPVANGGTGAATLTGYVKGTGTTAMTAAATVPVADISGTLPVASGGTGAVTLTGYVKGTGTTAMTAAATIPFLDLAGRAYGQPISTVDQTGNVSAATAVTFNTDLTGTGVSVVANTQITFTEAGTYMLSPSIQFANSTANDHDATVWFRKNGTNIANSATIVNVPKVADGGAQYFQIVFYETVTAGQYIEVMWLPENVAVTLEAIVAGAIAPAIPSVICPVMRIA